MTEQRRLRVGIFAGGLSAEHEVSIASAEAVLRAIDRDRYEPFVVYIDRAGQWPGTLSDGSRVFSDGFDGYLGRQSACNPVP